MTDLKEAIALFVEKKRTIPSSLRGMELLVEAYEHLKEAEYLFGSFGYHVLLEELEKYNKQLKELIIDFEDRFEVDALESYGD